MFHHLSWKRCAFLVSTLFVAVFTFAFLFFHARGPRLELPASPLDLGRGKRGEVMTGSFELKNSGSAPLEFKITASCKCNDLRPRGGTIAPGDVQVVQVAIKLDTPVNSSKGVELRIQTNEGKAGTASGAARYYVFAECPIPLKVSPTSIDFGQVREGDLDTCQRFLTIRDADDRAIRDHSKITFRWDSEYLLVEQDSSDADECRLRVTCLRELPRGDIYDTIELCIAGSEPAVQVPVHVRLDGDVSVAPSTVFLSVDPGMGRYKERDVFLWSTNPRRPLGVLLSFEAPEGITLADRGDSGTGRKRLRLCAREGAEWGPEGKVSVRCEGVNEPIEIRVVKPGRQ